MADSLLEHAFDAGQPNLVVIVRSDLPADDPDVEAAGTSLTRALASEPGLEHVESLWTLDLSGFRNPHPLAGVDGRSGLVIAHVAGDIDQAQSRAAEVADVYDGRWEGLDVRVGGSLIVAEGVIHQADADLDRAELLTAPLTILVLVVVFGGVLAAGVPVAVALLAVVGTFAGLAGLARITDVSIFALNLTTAMAAALGVDYALVIVSRHREQLVAGNSVAKAVERAVRTAGRSVLFSAATTVVSLGALLLFPVTYLRSFAVAGVAVVLMCAIAALTVVPALLVLLGERLRPSPKRRASGAGWARQAARVARHPWLVAAGSLIILVVLLAPARRLELSRIDDRVLPPGHDIRDLHDDLRDTFDVSELFAIEVVIPDYTPERSSELDAFITGWLAPIQTIARVDSAIGFYSRNPMGFGGLPPHVLGPAAEDTAARFVGDGGAHLRIITGVDPVGPRAEQLVQQLRDLPDAAPFELLVTGEAARLVDTENTITDRVPLVLATIAVATYLLMFLMTGSFLVALKAVLLNALSLGGMFGVLVWVFQDGNLSGLLGFTPTGSIDVFTPILMTCVAFGLSMDYEVFVVARMKEEYDLHDDNNQAVAAGLQRTGRVVTAAAVLLAVVFAAFTTGQVAVVKMIGVGLSIAILTDAFLIRATLMPALMTIAGRANWWAPGWVRRLHLRYGFWD